MKSLVISSLMVDLIMARYAPIYAGDRMIGGVFGGVLMGAGLAIIFCGVPQPAVRILFLSL